jgi:hypothetical protein
VEPEPESPCSECFHKRRACEERAARWIQSLMWVDDELGIVISYLDYHRARSERREYVEQLRKRLLWLRHNIK